jgi:hypothetical protein
MKTTSKCPKCAGTKLFVCDNHQPDHESANTIYPFVITAVPIRQELTRASTANNCRTLVGGYETWICGGCGYTEWYAKDPECLLETLSKMRNSGVRAVSS